MAAYSIYHGDSLLLEFELSNLGAAGLTGCNLSFTAKEHLSLSDDAPGVITRNTADFAIIQVGDATHTAVVDMSLLPADTAALAASVTHLLRYDLVLTLPDGKRFTVETGTLTVEPVVTQRVMS